VRPTDAARLLCEHTTRVLASIQDAEDALAALASGHSGRIRLGAFPTAGSSLHPGVAVRRLKGAQPARQVWAMTRPALAEQVPVLAMLACLESAANEFVRDVVEAAPASLQALLGDAER
jgi:hypothetical protein